jgi:hypothetical protein
MNEEDQQRLERSHSHHFDFALHPQPPQTIMPNNAHCCICRHRHLFFELFFSKTTTLALTPSSTITSSSRISTWTTMFLKTYLPFRLQTSSRNVHGSQISYWYPFTISISVRIRNYSKFKFWNLYASADTPNFDYNFFDHSGNRF